MAFVAVLAWVSKHWFFFHILVSFLAFLAFLSFHFWILESCRWLAGAHRDVEARHTAVKVMLFRSKRLQLRNDWQWWQILAFSEPLMSTQNTKHLLQKYTYLDLFRFYFSADSLPGNRYLNMVLMGISKFAMGLLPFAVSSVVGRRPIMLFSLVIANAAAWFAVVSNILAASYGHWSLTAVSLVVSAALDPAWKINHLYSAELFPTVVRNMARAMCNVGSRLGSVAAPMVVHLRAVHYLIPNLTFALFLSVQVLVVAVFMPETKDRALPQELPQVETNRHEERMVEQNLDTSL